ncbi:MAG TPA: hypothetical protein VFD13_04485, partial [Candidatus Kapabacteria bacterium]|nr:hypothetical protein [Candidatus Kapabacteria bacterium]
VQDPAMRNLGAFALALVLAGGFASCSEQLGVPMATSALSAQDVFWQPAQLTRGINYYVIRNGAGSNHLLTSPDGNHIEDAALNNEVTMVVQAGPDSVLIDSMGANSIFNLPVGYYFRADSSAPYILVHDTVVRDTTIADTVIHDTVLQDSTIRRDTVFGDTSVSHTVILDTFERPAGRLLLLLRTAMDSGRSWHAGMLFGPGIPNGMAVTATVLDRVDSLRIPPAEAGADSTFGESFRIRYAPENPGDTVIAFPIYWIAYFSRGIGPVLIQQFSLASVTESAQIIKREP